MNWHLLFYRTRTVYAYVIIPEGNGCTLSSLKMNRNISAWTPCDTKTNHQWKCFIFWWFVCNYLHGMAACRHGHLAVPRAPTCWSKMAIFFIHLALYLCFR